MTDDRFGLQSHVDTLYAQPRTMAFDASTPEEFAVWRDELRAEVRRLLRIEDRVLPDMIRAEKVHSIPREGYTEEKYALFTGEIDSPVYVLIPDAPPPYKPIMVFHGHNPSVQYILGNYPDEATAKDRRAVDNNYAQALAQAGYLVCAVEQRGFGERITPDVHSPDYSNSCRHLSFDYLLHDRTLLGERVWDGMVAISFIEARDDVVPGVMGATGNSGGGTTTLWLSAIDERVTVAVPSCYFCSFRASILGVYHCECNYVPGTLRLMEMGDLAALIAPRPFRAIAGENDPIFPVAAVREQYKTVERAYALLNAADKSSLTVHPGAHAYNHTMSQAWFGQWL